MNIVLAQFDFLVGDVRGNVEKILELAQQARALHRADLVVFPELAVSGYPPEDLVFHSGFRRQVDEGLARLRASAGDLALLVGYPEYSGERIYNSAALIYDGAIQANHRKSRLPNYKVFDEERYFEAGAQPTVVDFRGVRLGILICEDIWEREPAQLACADGAEILLVINASPYEMRKQAMREEAVRKRIADVGRPVIYLNMVAGQDELIFDGNSFAMDAGGELLMRAPAYAEGFHLLQLARLSDGVQLRAGVVTPLLDDVASVYGALVLGVRDYVNKHGFPGVVMGLSGGIDSALVLAIAVDALGAERVHAVMMPSRYTADISRDDAAAEAERLGVKYSVIAIEGMFNATLEALRDEFAGRAPDTTEENIQSRCRMLILMGISNKTGKMLLTTGNKSEMAVGYATLYGDMAGGFAPIKDCSKLLVYRLARYRNTLGEVIPRRVIDRPPSAELRPDQKDTDSLPPYEVLDPILEAFIEEDLSVDEIGSRGFERATVGRILDLVKRNEYKRRQAPPGVRVSRRAFGRDWRYPITNGYRRSS
ncbi:MAG: NAD+ synthase [Steroidobacteraceae bacterium]